MGRPKIDPGVKAKNRKDAMPRYNATPRAIQARKDWHEKNKDKNREYGRLWRLTHPGQWREHKYGITQDQYTKMLLHQGGGCAICGSINHLHVDHNHKTQAVRGILCANCNWGLGNFRDNPDLLRCASAYLERTQ